LLVLGGGAFARGILTEDQNKGFHSGWSWMTAVGSVPGVWMERTTVPSEGRRAVRVPARRFEPATKQIKVDMLHLTTRLARRLGKIRRFSSPAPAGTKPPAILPLPGGND
jgi:hypothetical protein